MDAWKYIFVLCAAAGPCVSRDVSYNEIKTLGISCSPFDTCNTTQRNINADRRNCQCDNQCAYFGDCCLDARTFSQVGRTDSSNLMCQKVKVNSGYFTIRKCRIGWREVSSKSKCENPPDIRDPLSGIPVTVARTSFNYKNHYCALCNDVRDDLHYWKMGTVCPRLNTSVAEYVRDNLTYNTNLRSWGVKIQSEFYECFFQPVAPKDNRYLRFCYPNVISSCSPRWRDEFIREKCESYTAFLHDYEGGVTYRNAHCALCNSVSLERLFCEIDSGKEFERISFTTLFDINLEKGNKIGPSSPKCNANEVYDPAFKRCQKLSCGLPFLELRGGKCVPKK